MSAQQPIEKIALPNIKNIIIVASGKGGVGKSTVAAGLAVSLAQKGFSTGLLDADIYGPSAPILFDIKDERPYVVQIKGHNRMTPIIKNGVKVMSIGFFFDPEQAILWRGPRVSAGTTQLITDTAWGNLDYLIIDTPPGTGDIHMTLLQKLEVSGVIVVTTPQLVALSDAQKAVTMFQDEQLAVPILGIVENMAWFTPSNHPDEKYFIFGEGGGAKLAEASASPLLAQIPVNEHICSNCDKGTLQELLTDQTIRNSFDALINGITNN